MTDTLSVSSAEDNEDDDTRTQARSNEDDDAPNQAHANGADTSTRSTLWTVPDEPPSDGPTHAQTSEPAIEPKPPRETRVHHPADPYASRIHIPSGRPLATFAKRFTPI